MRESVIPFIFSFFNYFCFRLYVSVRQARKAPIPLSASFFYGEGKSHSAFISYLFGERKANIDYLLLMQSASAGIPIKKNLSAFQSDLFWSDLGEIQCFFPQQVHTYTPASLPMFAQELPCVSSVGYFGCCVLFFLRQVKGRRFRFPFLSFRGKGRFVQRSGFVVRLERYFCLIFSIISGMFYNHVAAFMGWAVREEAIQTVSFSSPPFLLAIIFFVIFDCLRFARRVQTIFHLPHIPVMEAFSSSAENYLVGRTFLSFFFLESFPAEFSFSLRFFFPGNKMPRRLSFRQQRFHLHLPSAFNGLQSAPRMHV